MSAGVQIDDRCVAVKINTVGAGSTMKLVSAFATVEPVIVGSGKLVFVSKSTFERVATVAVVDVVIASAVINVVGK